MSARARASKRVALGGSVLVAALVVAIFVWRKRSHVTLAKPVIVDETLRFHPLGSKQLRAGQGTIERRGGLLFAHAFGITTFDANTLVQRDHVDAGAAGVRDYTAVLRENLAVDMHDGAVEVFDVELSRTAWTTHLEAPAYRVASLNLTSHGHVRDVALTVDRVIVWIDWGRRLTDAEVVAFSRASGAIVWRSRQLLAAGPRPLRIFGTRIHVRTKVEEMLDAETGEKWATYWDSAATVDARPESVVRVASVQDGAGPFRAEVQVQDSKAWKERWRHTLDGDLATGTNGALSAAANSSTIFVTLDDRRPRVATLCAIERETGAPRWTSPPFLAGDGIAAVRADENRVYVLPEAGAMQVFDSRTGKLLWSWGFETARDLLFLDEGRFVVFTEDFLVPFALDAEVPSKPPHPIRIELQLDGKPGADTVFAFRGILATSRADGSWEGTYTGGGPCIVQPFRDGVPQDRRVWDCASPHVVDIHSSRGDDGEQPGP